MKNRLLLIMALAGLFTVQNTRTMEKIDETSERIHQVLFQIDYSLLPTAEEKSVAQAHVREFILLMDQYYTFLKKFFEWQDITLPYDPTSDEATEWDQKKKSLRSKLCAKRNIIVAIINNIETIKKAQQNANR